MQDRSLFRTAKFFNPVMRRSGPVNEWLPIRPDRRDGLRNRISDRVENPIGLRVSCAGRVPGNTPGFRATLSDLHFENGTPHPQPA